METISITCYICNTASDQKIIDRNRTEVESVCDKCGAIATTVLFKERPRENISIKELMFKDKHRPNILKELSEQTNKHIKDLLERGF